jgi:type IV pilus assembly protein PilM
MGQEDAREAIYWEAEQHVPFDIDDITLDFEILQDDIGAGQMEVLLVAAKKDMIFGHADLIRDAGFTPLVIDVASFANQNAWEYCAGATRSEPQIEEPQLPSPDLAADFDEEMELGPDDENTEGEFVALLDVGGGNTNVHIVKDGVPYFTRDLPIGTTHFIEEFQKQLGLTYETAQAVAKGHTEEVDEQLVNDIVRTVGAEIFQGLEPSLSYLKTSGEADGIDRIVLSGGCAKLPGLSEYLASCYNIPSQQSDPLADIDYDPEVFGDVDTAELSPMLTVGVGLALRKAVGE